MSRTRRPRRISEGHHGKHHQQEERRRQVVRDRNREPIVNQRRRDVDGEDERGGHLHDARRPRGKEHPSADDPRRKSRHTEPDERQPPEKRARCRRRRQESMNGAAGERRQRSRQRTAGMAPEIVGNLALPYEHGEKRGLDGQDVVGDRDVGLGHRAACRCGPPAFLLHSTARMHDGRSGFVKELP